MKYTVKLWFTGTFSGTVSAENEPDAVQQVTKSLRDDCPFFNQVEDYDLVKEDEETEEDKDETT